MPPLFFIAHAPIPSSFFLRNSTSPRRPLQQQPHATVSSTPFDTTPTSLQTDPPLQSVNTAQNRAPSPSLLDTPLYDVAVIGAGPAGLSLAASLCRRGVSVALLDGALDKPWPNHYGVWYDEFSAVGLEQCATAVYPTTAIYAGDDKIVLDREYLRVDRVKLKRELMQRCRDAGATFRTAMVQRVQHMTEKESHVWYEGDAEDGNVNVVRARLVVDCTGHASRFTEGEVENWYVPPWEQAAYGIEAEVESYPYKLDEMLLMDFRDTHMQGKEELRRMSRERPTFLYVFPSGPGRAFFEETSVIAPKAVPFEELKERLYLRLAHDGVRVKRVIEEERSLIPMGGSLPRRAQRVVGFGGAACLVHPATGYMVARTVGIADKVAKVIVAGLKEGLEAQRLSERVWRMMWGVELRRQRDFLEFGAELLGTLDMHNSRRFFDAFFGLPEDLWSRFLGFGLDSEGLRIYFALYFFLVAGWEIRWGLLKAIVQIGKWRLVRSVLPVWMSSFDES